MRNLLAIAVLTLGVMAASASLAQAQEKPSKCLPAPRQHNLPIDDDDDMPDLKGHTRNVNNIEFKPGSIGWRLREAAAVRRIEIAAYAPPGVWGRPVPLPGHLGSARYAIHIEATGNVPTQIIGRVTFIDLTGKKVSREFNGSTRILTGNFVGQPTVEVSGIPTGALVRITVE